MKEIILQHLQKGRNNAISSRALQRLCNCSERVLRDTIRQMRLDGVVILSTTSGNGGYFLPADNAEAERYLHQEEQRARSIFAGLKAARAAVNTAPEQLKIDMGACSNGK